jgi:hypothetical protein
MMVQYRFVEVKLFLIIEKIWLWMKIGGFITLLSFIIIGNFSIIQRYKIVKKFWKKIEIRYYR